MITGIERLFINTFIDKRIADRMIYEFDSIKKRIKGDARFAHQAANIINEKMLVKSDRKLTVEVMTEFVRVNNKSELCYTVVGHYELKGKETTIQKALETADYWPGQSVIFVVPNVAIVIEEQTFGPPMRYLLVSK